MYCHFAAVRAGRDPGVPIGLFQHQDLLWRPREGAQEETHSHQLGLLGTTAARSATVRDVQMSSDFLILGWAVDCVRNVYAKFNCKFVPLRGSNPWPIVICQAFDIYISHPINSLPSNGYIVSNPGPSDSESGLQPMSYGAAPQWDKVLALYTGFNWSSKLGPKL